MKKIYRPLIKGTNWALAGLLSLFGLSACDALKDQPDMYGVPWAGYAVKGKVTDKETGKPIPGIEVKVEFSAEEDTYFSAEKLTTITDSNGNYELKDTPSWHERKLIATDIDGELNGSFANDTVMIDRENTTHIREEGNKNTWFNGHLVSETNISMRKTSE